MLFSPHGTMEGQMKEPRRSEWFDDDTFWKELYPFMFSEQRFEAAPGEIEQVVALTKPQGNRVLDLCCGPGRSSIALAQAGFSVTGVDRTSFLLKTARSRAQDAGVSIEWVQMDMRDFIREGAFDLAVSMFTSFGYFDDKSEDLLVLEHMHRSLKPGGVLLIDVMGKERLARILQPTTSNVLEDGTKLIQIHEIFDDWTRIKNEWLLIKEGKAASFTFHHTIYSGQELRDRMEQAGFIDIKLYGSLDGDPYGADALRLIAVGKKA